MAEGQSSHVEDFIRALEALGMKWQKEPVANPERVYAIKTRNGVQAQIYFSLKGYFMADPTAGTPSQIAESAQYILDQILDAKVAGR